MDEEQIEIKDEFLHHHEELQFENKNVIQKKNAYILYFQVS